MFVENWAALFVCLVKEILFVAFHLFVSGPLGVWKEKRRKGEKEREGRKKGPFRSRIDLVS